MTRKITYRFAFWQIALLLILLALFIWLWFGQQIAMIDERIDIMQNN